MYSPNHELFKNVEIFKLFIVFRVNFDSYLNPNPNLFGFGYQRSRIRIGLKNRIRIRIQKEPNPNRSEKTGSESGYEKNRSDPQHWKNLLQFHGIADLED